MDDPRWDPDMRLAHQDYESRVASLPPIVLAEPFDAARAINDELNAVDPASGPQMARTEDRWIQSRGRRVLCRLHVPRLDAPLPALVYFHGGGWVWSSVDTHDRLTREYAAAGDVAVVSVDYALSPEAKFPQALEECAGVVRHLAAFGDAWGLDASRIFVGGDSAGGNLALATALLLRDTGGPALRGVLAPYPVCDSDFSRPSYDEFGSGFMLTREKMEFYWRAYVPHAADRMHPLAAPLRANLTGLPPVLIHLAELDVLRSEGEAMVERLRDAGVDVELEVFAGVLHGFMRAIDLVPKARRATELAGAWLRRQASR